MLEKDRQSQDYTNLNGLRFNPLTRIHLKTPKMMGQESPNQTAEPHPSPKEQQQSTVYGRNAMVSLAKEVRPQGYQLLLSDSPPGSLAIQVSPQKPDTTEKKTVYVNVQLNTERVQLSSRDGSFITLPKGTVWEELSKVAQKVWDTLSQRAWFKNSSAAIQWGLKALAGNPKWLGFVEDLSQREGTSREFQEISLASIQTNNFGGSVVFNVKMPNGKDGQYEYFSWRQGRFSGAKGIVVVQNKKGETLGLILRKGTKFAPGNQKILEAVGGFKKEDEKSTQNFLRELSEEIGLESPQITKVIEFGTVLTDPGMTPNEVSLFAAVIQTAQAKQLIEKWSNRDPLEGESKTVFIPEGSLAKAVKDIQDSYTLTCLCKAKFQGII